MFTDASLSFSRGGGSPYHLISSKCTVPYLILLCAHPSAKVENCPRNRLSPLSLPTFDVLGILPWTVIAAQSALRAASRSSCYKKCPNWM